MLENEDEDEDGKIALTEDRKREIIEELLEIELDANCHGDDFDYSDNEYDCYVCNAKDDTYGDCIRYSYPEIRFATGEIFEIQQAVIRKIAREFNVTII